MWLPKTPKTVAPNGRFRPRAHLHEMCDRGQELRGGPSHQTGPPGGEASNQNQGSGGQGRSGRGRGVHDNSPSPSPEPVRHNDEADCQCHPCRALREITRQNDDIRRQNEVVIEAFHQQQDMFQGMTNYWQNFQEALNGVLDERMRSDACN